MQSIIITKDTIDKKANGTTESSLSANSLVERSHTTKRYANSFTNTIALIIVGAILISGCSRKRYVPVVKYPYPSYSALNKTLRGVYGDRYSYAGQGPNRFDCSGLTYFSYATMNKWLPRRAIDQARVGKTVQLNELQYGDLIFFDTHRRNRRKVNHVGIYIGKGYFVHASSAKRRVIKSRIQKPFYKHRVVVCKRHIKPKNLPKHLPAKNLFAKPVATKAVVAHIDNERREIDKTPPPQYPNENLF